MERIGRDRTVRYPRMIVGVVATLLMWSASSSAFQEPPLIPVSKPSGGKTWIVGTGGDFADLEAADGNVSPGDIIRVKAGTYDAFDWRTSGSSGNEIVIEAFGDGDVIIRSTVPNIEAGDILASWIILDGGSMRQLVFDGSANQITQTKAVLYLKGGSNITVSRVQVKNNGASEGSVIIKGDNNRIYNSVFSNNEGEGIYIRDGSNHEIRNNIFFANKSGGIQFNPHVRSENVDNVIVDGNMLYNNGYGAIDGDRGGIQILVGPGHTLSNITVVNNIVWNSKRQGISLGPCSGTMSNIYIYHNTLYGNNTYGITTDSDCANLGVVVNNIAYNNTLGDIVTERGGSYKSVSNNITADPSFASIDDNSVEFLLLDSASPAIDSAEDMSGLGISLTVDIYDTPRPMYGTSDVGAVEYVVKTPQGAKIVK